MITFCPPVATEVPLRLVAVLQDVLFVRTVEVAGFIHHLTEGAVGFALSVVAIVLAIL
jgi:hypothetical protein